MPKSPWFPGALASTLLLFGCLPVSAQVYEDVGTRALGMAGAFVAVADDASATWWNPAGLATGATMNAIVEYGQTTAPRDLFPGVPARRATVTDTASAFPGGGFSIYRVRVSQILPDPASTGSGVATRQDPGGAATPVRSLSLSQYGLTVGQSVGDNLVLGTTLKLLRGGVESGLAPVGSDLLDVADDLEVDRDWGADLDVGVMARFGGLKLGLSVRNMFEPDFGEGEDGVDVNVMTLERQARTGVSWTSQAHGALSAFTIAADFDLTTTPTILGDARHMAFGSELWLGGRFGVRGGFSNNTIDDGGSTRSGGASLGLTKSLFLDAALATGSDRTLRGWSGSVRFAY
jgi:hypothetical protein